MQETFGGKIDKNQLGVEQSGYIVCIIPKALSERAAMSKTTDLRTIYLVDDDPAIRHVICLCLSKAGYNVVGFADGPSLLAAARSELPSCILLDLYLPGQSGLEILKRLNREGIASPILMISGSGGIAEAVDALKNGAVDFIEKPFTAKELIDRVTTSVGKFQAGRDIARIKAPYLAGREPLTRREKEVMEHCVRGASTKETGLALGLSPRTVEDHRASLMRKLGARNVADLVRMVVTASLGSAIAEAPNQPAGQNAGRDVA